MMQYIRKNYNTIALVVIFVSLVMAGLLSFTNTNSFLNLEQQLQSQWLEQQRIETNYVSSQIANEIHQIKMELIALTLSPQLLHISNTTACAGDLGSLHTRLGGRIQSLFRTDALGTVIECSPQQYQSQLGINVQNKDYYKIPVRTRAVYASGLVGEGAESEIIISAPIFESEELGPYPNTEGRFLGIYFSIIKIPDLYLKYVHPVTTEKQKYYILVDIKKEFIIQQNSNFSSVEEIRKQIGEIAQERSTFMDMKAYGRTIVTSANIVFDDQNWVIIVFTPLNTLTRETQRIHVRHYIELFITFFILVLMIVYLFFLYRSRQSIHSQLMKANITLKKLGIKTDIETNLYAQTDTDLQDGNVYLVRDEDENQAHELFISTLNKGYTGLGFIREDPNIFKKKYNLYKTALIWLSKISVENVHSETNSDTIFSVIAEFITTSKKNVILIDRLDFLMAENNPTRVIQMIQHIKDIASNHNTIIIVGLKEGIISKEYVHLLEAETVDLFGKELTRNTVLSDQESAILSFVNQHNIYNQLVSYKDITKQFNITKPTTRVRISQLQKTGLITIEHRGRFKSIKITSSGRKFVK